MRRIALLIVMPLAFATGCQEEEPQAEEFDQALLDQYRAALPQEERLEADAPGDDGNAPGDATFAQFSRNAAIGINALAIGIVRLLDFITETIPPTRYDTVAQEFWWGPYPSDDDYGKWALYIQDTTDPETGEHEDFRYWYALIRVDGDDLSTAAPVVWGGATPDPSGDDDLGVGVTLWDFEESNRFSATYDPDYVDPNTLTNAHCDVPEDNRPEECEAQGRFVAFYGAAEEGPGERFVFNVAMFRDFKGGEKPEDQEANADYFYGRFSGDNNGFPLTVSFLDFELEADFCSNYNDGAGGVETECFDENEQRAMTEVGTSTGDEVLRVHSAFVNDGVGRAEVRISHGDAAVDPINAVECWNALVETEYWEWSLDSGPTWSDASPGQANVDCLTPFSVNDTLKDDPGVDDDLHIWNLDDLRADEDGLMDGLECAAELGIVACNECQENNGGDTAACVN